eukprot:scaffold2266_cov155-Skeletonema_dohrnii-CCMP3373.AAC.8
MSSCFNWGTYFGRSLAQNMMERVIHVINDQDAIMILDDDIENNEGVLTFYNSLALLKDITFVV